MSCYPGAIDCDIHPTVPGIKALLPFMDDYWQEAFVSRGIDGLEMASYPPGAPISCRADWRPAKGRPAADPATIARQSLDVMGTAFAICNPLTGGQVAVSESMGAAVCRAVNDWISKEFLDILRCPLDPSRAKLVPSGEDLLCERCALCFPVRDGFPILVIEEAQLPKGVESIRQLPCQTESKG